MNQKGQQLFAYGQKPGKKRFIPNSGFLNQAGQGSGAAFFASQKNLGKRKITSSGFLDQAGQGSGVFQLLISAVVAMAILGVLLGILGIITPPGQDIAVIARDNLSQAFTKQGVLITSGKINIAKGASITSTTGGPDLGVPDTHICTGLDSALTGFDNAAFAGVLTYNGSSAVAVRVRAYCYWDATQLETKVQELGIGMTDTLNCPGGYSSLTDTDIGCMVGITKG